eukprot:g36805.t1
MRAALEENAYSRMKQVLRWYLSGFYKKPKVRQDKQQQDKQQQDSYQEKEPNDKCDEYHGKKLIRYVIEGNQEGLKKPYNPILGETFRCYWYHPKTDSRTFYIAEQ